MPARRRVATTASIAFAGVAPLVLTALGAAPPPAAGSMGDPLSPVSQWNAEGPRSPQ
ncbi:hypothetical protein [Streptomyces sp. NPDC054829]